jgi:AraC family L-rhamnose operon regulatory protein RhaS
MFRFNAMEHLDLFAEYGDDHLVRLPLHKNPGLEIVYIERGKLLWECEGHLENIPEESIYFTLPWQKHGSATLFEPDYKIHFIVIKLKSESVEKRDQIQFKPEMAFEKEVEEKISDLLCHCSQHAWPASPMLKVLMPEILSELKHPTSFHSTRIRTLLKQIILELVQTIRDGKSKPAHFAANSFRLQKLLKELDRNYGEKWTLASMAEKAGLKRSQFSEIFKHITGESPLSYLKSVRVLKAAQQLKNTSLSITDIAFECGFSSSQHFASVFKKTIGQTPLKYRKQGLPEIHLPRVHLDSNTVKSLYPEN